MPPLHFHQEDVDFRLPDEKQTSDWITRVVAHEGYTPGELNFIFCSDNHLHTMNVTWLQHDTYTDIITFDQSEEDHVLEGDIFISIERVQDNANGLSVEFDTELHRVMIHGVLHLMGYRDKTDREKSLMRKKEEACLSLRPFRNNP